MASPRRRQVQTLKAAANQKPTAVEAPTVDCQGFFPLARGETVMAGKPSPAPTCHLTQINQPTVAGTAPMVATSRAKAAIAMQQRLAIWL